MAGRSVLQNEIIGLLSSEFPLLPSNIEDIPLNELCTSLEPSQVHTFSRPIAQWLENRIKAKFPAAVSVSRLREHLSKSFGLQDGRQSAFLLTADLESLPQPLKEESVAWATIDIWASQYLTLSGLDLHPAMSPPRQEMESTTEKQPADARLSALGQAMSHLLARHFGGPSTPLSSNGMRPRAEEREEKLKSLREDFDAMSSELGEEFIQGIHPKFDSHKVYIYDSAWNWVLQDLYLTVYKIIDRPLSETGDDLLRELQRDSDRLNKRATSRLIECATTLLREFDHMIENDGLIQARMFLRSLLNERNILLKTNDTSEGDGLQTAPFPLCANASEAHCTASVACSDVGSHSPNGDKTASSASSSPSSSVWTRSGTRLAAMTHSIEGVWHDNDGLTAMMQRASQELGSARSPLLDATVLIIGAGPTSIAACIVELLLTLGSFVVLATREMDFETRQFYSAMYTNLSAPAATLVLLPFNQGSHKDISSLVEYVNVKLGREIDHLLPFAAVSQNDHTLEELDSKSELALRVMLTNTLRFIGAIASSKRTRGIINHVTQVILPLSPNHGQFGQDGLYAECKLALQAVMRKWFSESWSNTVTVCGVIIGWTRGTGLMVASDAIAQHIEDQGVKTFAASEMAHLIAGLLVPCIKEASFLQPMLCDFTGGLGALGDLRQILDHARAASRKEKLIRDRLDAEAQNERRMREEANVPPPQYKPRANIHLDFPKLPKQYRDMVPSELVPLESMLDMESVVVVAGFAELGPLGNSRTRWEYEKQGQFSLEGCIELAWMMGFIEWRSNRKGQRSGWVDRETAQAIEDVDIKRKYEQRIMDHTGIRILTPAPAENPDPRRESRLYRVVVTNDLHPFECSRDAAVGLKSTHRDRCIIHMEDDNSATVQILRGATLYIPLESEISHFVGAQLPSGWDPTAYGISPDLVTQVDPVTLYALVCAAEGFLSAGVTDVYELYKYMHVSEMGNCLGSGIGGSSTFDDIFRRRFLDEEVQSDALAESFINTPAAWVNLLLLSASGPIKTPAGACATAFESLDTGCELLIGGKAKMCIVGGSEYYSSHVAREFNNMSATTNASPTSRLAGCRMRCQDQHLQHVTDLL